ncbi:MAG: hypothetical protein WED10_03265 [Brumimicrobium sp.]
MVIEKALRGYSHVPIQRHLLLKVLKDYKRPNDKISDMIKKGELVALKRGLYIPGKAIDLIQPSSFIIANHLYGPSYISLESALSQWGLIPEKVVEVSSVTTKTKKTFYTPVGRFSYHHLPLPYYSFGIKQERLIKNQHVLIASPEKAICDKIILTPKLNLRSKKQTIAFLEEDLRIDEEGLVSLDLRQIDCWLKNAPKKTSLEMLIKTISSL